MGLEPPGSMELLFGASIRHLSEIGVQAKGLIKTAGIAVHKSLELAVKVLPRA